MCLEIFGSRTQSKKSRERGVDKGHQGHFVKEILLISCNGMDVSVYHIVTHTYIRMYNTYNNRQSCVYFHALFICIHTYVYTVH